MRNAPRFLSLLLALFVGQAAAQAWSGAGANDNWSTGANWAGGSAPSSAPTTAVSFGTTLRRSPVVDAPWTINRMDFSIGGYSFSGQAITFSGASPGVLVPIATAYQRIVVATPVVLTGPMAIVNFGILDWTGGISGTGPIAFSGAPGFSGLAGVNTFTGGTTVLGSHVLALLGGSMLGPVTVDGFSAFTGGGTVAGAVTVAGTLTPNPIHGTLRTGNVTNSGFMALAIAGTTQGTQYSHLDVTGAVVLVNPGLSLSGSFAPPVGTVFTIISNDGTDPVIGAFASLPEGATVVFNGVPLTISYVGGTGNDVTLSSALGPVSPVQTPTLSTWALLLLAMVLPLIGAIRLRR